jgi:transposase
MVSEHQGRRETQAAAIGAVAQKIGGTVETLRGWVLLAERYNVTTSGISIDALESSVRQLRQANEILRKASAYFAEAERVRSLRTHLSYHRLH